MDEKFIEPRIKDLVVLLNKIPQLRPISSCEGHWDSPKDKSAYVICEYDSKGYDLLEDFFCEGKS